MTNAAECSHENTSVIDSRATHFKTFNAIRRRRKCMDCGYRYLTYEIEDASLESLIEEALAAVQGFDVRAAMVEHIRANVLVHRSGYTKRKKGATND